MLATSESGLEINFHPCFPYIARFKSQRFLKLDIECPNKSSLCVLSHTKMSSSSFGARLQGF